MYKENICYYRLTQQLSQMEHEHDLQLRPPLDYKQFQYHNSVIQLNSLNQKISVLLESTGFFGNAGLFIIF